MNFWLGLETRPTKESGSQCEPGLVETPGSSAARSTSFGGYSASPAAAMRKNIAAAGAAHERHRPRLMHSTNTRHYANWTFPHWSQTQISPQPIAPKRPTRWPVWNSKLRSGAIFSKCAPPNENPILRLTTRNRSIPMNCPRFVHACDDVWEVPSH